MDVYARAGVVEFYRTMSGCGITVWIDGGWGVDALLGKQTRPHRDLDIAIQQEHVPKLREVLAANGHQEVRLEEARPHNFIVGDMNGHEIDVHVIVLDENGDGIYGPAENGEKYLAASLTRTGVIGGHQVRCISPEWMVKFHSEYELAEKDFRDVSALCEKFGLDLPREFLKWVK